MLLSLAKPHKNNSRWDFLEVRVDTRNRKITRGSDGLRLASQTAGGVLII